MTFDALNLDFAATILNDTFADGKAQPSPSCLAGAGRIFSKESFKNMGQAILRYPGAKIFDLETRAPTCRLLVTNRHENFRRYSTVLHGIHY